MPKVVKEEIPHHRVRTKSGIEYYHLHKPSQCRLKFPLTNEPIHKCTTPKQDYTVVPQPPGWRTLVLPKEKKNFYPAIIPKNEFERLKQQAKIVSQEETIAALKAQEELMKEEARQSEERKAMLKKRLKPQPDIEGTAGSHDPELDGPDQDSHTMCRAEILRADELQGPRICNKIILASKCHAIRDAQITEKELIQKEIEEEERRLDAIMEKNRQAACTRAEQEEKLRHQLRLQNLAAVKEQIRARKKAKLMEAQRVEEESILLNEGKLAIQFEEAQTHKEKELRRIKLKEMLERGNAELQYFKQLQEAEERKMNIRIENYVREKMEREARRRKEAEELKVAKQKGIEYISKARKTEQFMKEELERIRNLKIQEDVEREYRKKEKEAAIKRNREMRALQDTRVKQIEEIRRLIAREMVKDEQYYKDAARRNEEQIRKAKELEEQKKKQIEKHRQEILKQIKEKERTRAELREKSQKEGIALRLEEEQHEKYEKRIVKMKVAAMREQNIPEKYVKEVEHALSKTGYLES